jgi:hypothetical protein
MATQCQGTNQNGEPCSAHVYEGETWCRWHDPARADERAAWSRKGGAARSNKARARRQLADAVLTVHDLDALLCRALVQVAAGKLEPNVGSAMAGIAKTVVGIRQTGELERRLEELERAAGIGTLRRLG